MKRQTTIEIVTFVALVATCASLRVALRDVPNFAPVAAVALFAGYFFRSAVLALCVPLSSAIGEHKPSLEDVFLHYVGKELQGEEDE